MKWTDEEFTLFIKNQPQIVLEAGLIPGAFFMRKFGRNPAVATGATGEDIWGGSSAYYTFQTSAQTVEILGDAADIITSGAGAWTVEVQGLDANYNIISETVEMNGVTPVLLTYRYLRVFRMRVMTAGVNGVATGPITLRVSGGGTTMAVITAGTNQTTMAIYTIPANYTAFLYHAHGTINPSGAVPAAREGIMAFLVREFGSVFQEKQILGFTQDSPFHWPDLELTPVKIPEKADVKMRAFNLSDASDITATFNMVLIPNKYLYG